MPEDTADPTLLGACAQRALIARRELLPSELIERTLQRIERLNPRLNAVVTLSPSALDEARALDRRLERGEGESLPLCGLPVGIKDVTPVAGLRCTYGSPLYRDHVAGEDALVVRRLRAAGAVIVGKTNTPEFATGGNTFNEVFGRTHNPWNPELSAGGSTGGGAAALASGMISIAEGTDLGGSLRIPASFCGIVGLRPSPGLVPTWPSDYIWDTLQVTGPMARTAADVALALQAMAGNDPRWPLAQPGGRDFVAAAGREAPLRARRFAYCPDIAGIGVDAGIEQVAREAAFALRDADAEVEEIELDVRYAKEAFLALRGHWMVVQQLDRLERKAEFGDNLRGNVDAGLARTTLELAAAEHGRARLCAELGELLESFDHLITPSMAVPPFPVSENYPTEVGGQPMQTYVDWIAPTFILSLSGLPVASVPCGLDAAGLPVGLQVVGRRAAEEEVLAAAAGIQARCPIGLPQL
ncbi:MAG: amidase [Acidobacteria bacterium]|nr:MAG: amidase [Acidobacteriota bacterium]REK09746.1 MAG: amidase [Acidobacteriota bacterium]